MPAGIALCGEESAGTGSNHIREKDGVWAVLFWLNVLAARRESVAAILADHWRRYGRNFYARHDYEGVPTDAAAAADRRTARAASRPCPGGARGGFTIAARRRVRLHRSGGRVGYASGRGSGSRCEGGSRIVYRLSGTGTEGATLRVYLERFEPDPAGHDAAPDAVLAPLAAAAASLADIPGILGRTRPDVVA